MKNNNAYCPKCGDTEHKNIAGKPACSKCGRVVSEEEIAADIKARFAELREQGRGLNLKFFEFNKYDYYALIGAESEEEAIKHYEEIVADITEKDGGPDEITKDSAKEKYFKSCSKDDYVSDESFEEAISESPCIILIASDLV